MSLRAALRSRDQEVACQLRDWARYLHARLALLEHAECELDDFEQTEAGERVAQARQNLAALPAPLLALFERAERERLQRRAKPGQPAVDSLTLEVGAVRELLAEATEPDSRGRVLLPAEVGDSVEWVEADAALARARPDEMDYEAAAGRLRRGGRLQRALAAAAALGLTVTAGWIMLRADEGGAAGLAPRVSANGTPVAQWQVSRVVLGGDGGRALVVRAAEGDWPADGAAHLRAGTFPAQVCLPPQALTGLVTVTLEGPRVPERTYVVGGAGRPDLLLSPCAAGSAPVGAALVRVGPPEVAEAGEARLVGGALVALRSAGLRAEAGGEPLPAGVARLTVALTSSQALDWALYRPLLRLADGSERAAPEVRAAGAGAELTFLVASPAGDAEGQLCLADPGGGGACWHIHVEAAAGRVGP